MSSYQFEDPFVDITHHYVNRANRLKINELLEKWAEQLELDISPIENAACFTYLKSLILEINKARSLVNLSEIDYPYGLEFANFKSWLFPILYETDRAIALSTTLLFL